jgi:hypothetical protein
MVNVLDLTAAVGFWNMMARNLNGPANRCGTGVKIMRATG